MRSARDEFARGAGVGLGDLAGEVGLGGGDGLQPFDAGRTGGLLIAVGDLEDGLLVGVEVGGAGLAAVLGGLLVELRDLRRTLSALLRRVLSRGARKGAAAQCFLATNAS